MEALAGEGTEGKKAGKGSAKEVVNISVEKSLSILFVDIKKSGHLVMCRLSRLLRYVKKFKSITSIC